MKKTVDIIGLPVISIAEGKELGSVKSLVINASEGKVSALIIDDGKWYKGASLLPFSSVMGLGESAITTESIDGLVTVSTAPEFEKHLDLDIKIIGTKVLTKSGRFQGKVNEYIIDATGKIIACEVENLNGEINNLSSQNVVTFGKEVLIISDSEVVVGENNPINTISSPVSNIETPVKQESQQQQVPLKATEVKEDSSNQPAKETDESAKKFDEKHRKYLLGKKASRRIETDNGMLIVDQGGEITEEVLQKAKLAGKFVELSMNIQ